MAELFVENLIPSKTLKDIFRFRIGEDNIYPSNFEQQTVGQELINPRIIKGIMEGGTFKTSNSKARIEMFPAYDPTIGLVVYDDSESEIFKIFIGGAYSGDIVIGKTSGQYLKWNDTTLSLSFISDTLDTESKHILKDFVFSPSDYSGAFKSGDITWNTTTGAITGGSGIVMYKNGIVGATAGVTTFSIDATTGNAVFAGSLSATSGTLGALTIASGGNIKQGQTAYNTGTGFWLGDVSGTPKLSIGNSTTKSYLLFDGTNTIISNLKFENTIAGANVIATAPNEVWTASTSFVEVKRISVGITGTVRVYVNWKSSSAAKFAYLEIWQTGGMSANYSGSTKSTSYSTSNVDIAQLVPGDEIWVQIKTEDGSSLAYVKNMKICVATPPFPMTIPVLDSANLV